MPRFQTSSTPCGPLLFRACLLVLLPVRSVAADWQTLTGNSPFGQASGAAAVAPDELEFRGVVEEDGILIVNLYNPANKTSQWLPAPGRSQDVSVEAYDRQTGKLAITRGGRTLTLALKQARVTLQAPPAPAAPAQTAAAPGAQPAAPDPANRQEFFRNLPPEARAMIEEIRRRRSAAAAERLQERERQAGNTAGTPKPSVNRQP